VRSNAATTRRVRVVTVLSVAAAVTVMLGAILVLASVVMRLVTRHQPAHMIQFGLDVVAAGIAFGLVVLVAFAIGRIGGAGRSRHGRSAARGRSAEPAGPGTAGRRPAAGQPSATGQPSAASRPGTAWTGAGPGLRQKVAVTPDATAERARSGRPC